MSEAYYDEHIAPALLKISDDCREHGVSFLALAQYNADGDFGRTLCLQPDASGVIRYADALAKARNGLGVNIDAFMFAVAKEAREHGHSSIVLSQMGVPTSPADKEPSHDL